MAVPTIIRFLVTEAAPNAMGLSPYTRAHLMSVKAGLRVDSLEPEKCTQTPVYHSRYSLLGELLRPLLPRFSKAVGESTC
jgi:hypothetical protein